VKGSFTETYRDGERLLILANEVVPGDLVQFTTGDRIPADLRVIDAVDLEIDESSLTGEEDARRKTSSTCRYENDSPFGDPVALAERSCIAFMGTLVRNGKLNMCLDKNLLVMFDQGRGSGIVIATGAETEFGVIFSMMQDVEEKRTPLQLNMDELAKKLSIMSFGVIGMICLIGILQKRSWLEMFTIGGMLFMQNVRDRNS